MYPTNIFIFLSKLIERSFLVLNRHITICNITMDVNLKQFIDRHMSLSSDVCSGSRARTLADGPPGQGLGPGMANYRAVTICNCPEDLIPEKSN